MTNQYNKVVSVVSKSPSERTEKDAKSIILWFKKKSRLFRELDDDVVCDIIKNCEFTSQKKDDVLIRQGEVGNNFYILLRGGVSIYIQGSPLDGDDFHAPLPHLEGPEELSDGGLKPKVFLDRSKYGNFIVQLEEGQSFGELALINKDCIRNASIIVDCPSDLLVVDRKLYNRSLKAAQTADFEQRNNFVSTCPLFKWWSSRYKRQMAYCIVKETISFHEFIFKQGQPADRLYFIISGQAKILLNPTRHLNQYSALYRENEEALEEADNTLSNKYKIPQAVPKRPRTAPSTRRRQHQRPDLELCLVGENEILGAGEFITGLKTYYQTVQTTEICVSYSLDQKHYDRLIVRKHPRTLDIIQYAVRARLQNRILRMPEEHVSLFKIILQKMEDQTNQGQQVNKPLMLISRKKSHKEPVIHSPRYRLKSPSHLDSQRQQGVEEKVGPNLEKTGEQSEAESQLVAESKEEWSDDIKRPLMKNDCNGGQQNTPDEGNEKLDEPFPGDKRLIDESTLSDPTTICHHNNMEVTEFKGQNLFRNPSRCHHTFHDWSSSDLVLADLEIRLRDWLFDVASDLGIRKGQPRPVSMRRVTIQNGFQPRPGAKVIFTKKGAQTSCIPTSINSQQQNITDARPESKQKVKTRIRPRTSPVMKVRCHSSIPDIHKGNLQAKSYKKHCGSISDL